tara:strand:- start:2 stop:979 length:978 start_codon:yes stop_codon:yes gene_type:complete
MSCDCCCGIIKKSNQVNNYNNCDLDESNYVDQNLLHLLHTDGVIGVIHYFQATHSTYLYSILEFYNKMEQAKIRGVVQVKVNWGTLSDGEIICGDLECFWKMYNQKGNFYKTILVATKYHQWFITQQRQKKMGINNCCLFDVPSTDRVCGCETNAKAEVFVPDQIFQSILQDSTITTINVDSINFIDDLILKILLDDITTIGINSIFTVGELETLTGIECIENLNYLQIKDMFNNLTSINLCYNLKLTQLILDNNPLLRLLILPRNNNLNHLDLQNNLTNYGPSNPLVLDGCLDSPCTVITTNGPYVSYNGILYPPTLPTGIIII